MTAVVRERGSVESALLALQLLTAVLAFAGLLTTRPAPPAPLPLPDTSEPACVALEAIVER